jgi:hypothetical protein
MRRVLIEGKRSLMMMTTGAADEYAQMAYSNGWIECRAMHWYKSLKAVGFRGAVMLTG